MVGIQALAEFGSLVYSRYVSISASIRSEGLDKAVTIENSNMMVLQVIDVSKKRLNIQTKVKLFLITTLKKEFLLAERKLEFYL